MRKRDARSLIAVRLLLSALRCSKGAVADNLAAHWQALSDARDAGCGLAVFPEMSLTGSVDPALRADRLVALNDPCVGALAGSTGDIGVAAVFGIAERNTRGPFITQVVAAHGQVVGVQRKRQLGEGEGGYRAADEDAVFDVAGTRFAIAICAEAGYDRPFAHAETSGARLVCFPAAPGLHGRRVSEAEWRAGWEWWCGSALGDACRHARARNLWVAIASQAGSTDDEDFPGLAALIDPTGEVVTQTPDWQAADLVVEVPDAR
jgi:predicted amidohydrolase